MLGKYIALSFIVALLPATSLASDQSDYSVPLATNTGVFDWSGFYLGGHGGYDWSNSKYLHIETAFVGGPAINSESFAVDPSGWAGGFHTGYQHQWDRFVFGAELAYTFSDADDRALTNLNAIARYRDSEINDIWSISGKAGYAWDRTLGYVKAGYANTELSYINTRISDGVVVGHSEGRVGGFLIGGGVEHALTGNWILGLDYAFTKFSVKDQQQFRGGAAVSAFNTENDLSNHNLSARLSYKF